MCSRHRHVELRHTPEGHRHVPARRHNAAPTEQAEQARVDRPDRRRPFDSFFARGLSRRNGYGVLADVFSTPDATNVDKTHRDIADRGAVLVESALVFLLLVMLTFGIIEWGLYIKDANTVTAATRAGARTASALPRQPGFADRAAAAVTSSLTALDRDAAEVLWVYRADANGMPDSGGFSDATPCSVCFRYVWDTATQSWREVHAGWAYADQVACGGQNSDALGVYLRARHHFFTGFFGPDRAVADRTVMRLEPVPGQCRP